MQVDINKILDEVKHYFNLKDYKENEEEVIGQVSAGVTFKGPQLWILMFAILTASLGLNTNSTAVIIGAMLISPLMGPIIGMGLSVGIYDFDLLKRSLKNFAVAVAISVLTATLYFLLSPISDAKSELLARTSPTLYDVLIAFFGGAAGVLALTTKGKGQVIPGVAIATALMPPLCTAGYGIATWQLNYFLGAFYLFFINTVFIALSTFLGVKLLKFKTLHNINPERTTYAKRLITLVVIITMIPATIMTWSIVKDNMFENNVQSFVKRELSQPGTQILSTYADHDTLHIVSVGRALSDSEIDDARSRLPYYSLKGYHLSVIQSSDPSNIKSLTDQVNMIVNNANMEKQQLAQMIEGKNRQLQAYEGETAMAQQIMDEAKTLFQNVNNIKIGRLTDGTSSSVVAIVTSKGNINKTELDQWLKTRLQNSEVEIIFKSSL